MSIKNYYYHQDFKGGELGGISLLPCMKPVSGSKWPSAIRLFWYTKIVNFQTCRLKHASKSINSLFWVTTRTRSFIL